MKFYHDRQHWSIAYLSSASMEKPADLQDMTHDCIDHQSLFLIWHNIVKIQLVDTSKMGRKHAGLFENS